MSNTRILALSLLCISTVPAGASADELPAATLARLEAEFPECQGMLSETHVDELRLAAEDPKERFETWRRQRFTMIEESPVVRCQSRLWRELRRATGSSGPDRADTAEASDLSIVFRPVITNRPMADGVDDYQGETQVAVNPSNPLQLVAGANTFHKDPACQSPTGGNQTYGTQALFGSTDGGKTWTYNCAPWDPSVTGGVPSSQAWFGSDPALAWDASGNAYAAYMLVSQNASFVTGVAIVVAKSTDSGLSWNPLGVVVNNIASTNKLDDKEMIAVDTSNGGAHSHPGRLYVIWDQNNVERVAYSDDGVTWITKFVGGPGIRIGGNLAVGADGTVYAVWNRVYSPNNLEIAQGDDTYFSKSTDGGETWSAATLVWTHALGSFGSYYWPLAQDERGVNAFCALDVNRNPASAYFGRLHLVAGDLKSEFPSMAKHHDVFMRTSTDGGGSWLPPVRVPDDPGNTAQFLPWMAVDQSDGSVNVAWYDTRNDQGGWGTRTQMFYARSTNGGVSFAPDIKITDGGWAFPNHVGYSDDSSILNDLDNPNQYGDYIGVAAANRKVHVVWTDTRQFHPTKPAGNQKREDVALTTLTNCSVPKWSGVLTVTQAASAVDVSWSTPSWGTSASGGTYAVSAYAGAGCQGAAVATAMAGQDATSALVSLASSGTYSFNVKARNNCTGTSLTPMSALSVCSAAIDFTKP
jgi:hypothetical protein